MRIRIGNPMSAMKNAVFVLTLLTILPAIVSAQAQSRQHPSTESPAQSEASTGRNRVVGPKVSNHAESAKARPVAPPVVTPVSGTGTKGSQMVWGNTPIKTPETAQVIPPKTTAVNDDVSAATRTLVQPTMLKVNAPNTSARAASSPVSSAPAPLYSVGPGDVLDIRLSNSPSRESTLFTVFQNGSIDYPLLDGPLVVAGMTTDEIARMLSTQIKVIKAPKVSVSVRDYTSHTIVISGLVDNPGTKILRRQVMPLYALLAEASVRPEATTVTIVRNGKEGTPLSLKDEQAMATLISSGDAIRLSGGSAGPSQYIYVGGDVAAPGEKNFRSGMTVTQALMSAGTNVSSTKTVRVSRRTAAGLLSTVEYDVPAIAQGKTPDPQLVPGDRIEVKRAK
jgi:polysaccharide export outer membrane protein